MGEEGILGQYGKTGETGHYQEVVSMAGASWSI